MDENKKVLVNFINEDTGQEHELEIPLGITANALVLALSRAYGLHIEEYGSQECYMACEHPVCLLTGNRQLSDLGIRNGSQIIFRRK